MYDSADLQPIRDKHISVLVNLRSPWMYLHTNRCARSRSYISVLEMQVHNSDPKTPLENTLDVLRDYTVQHWQQTGADQSSSALERKI